MPPASRLLRLLAFAVPAALALAGVQPVLGAATGAISAAWAVQLTAPALAASLFVFLAARRADRGDHVQPPWYAAWLLFPGAFLLAGAASMCIIGALVEYPLIAPTMWALLGAGSVAWTAAVLVVAHASR